MKRVFVGGIIMGRAPKDMKHPELRGNDTVLRDALLVKINCCVIHEPLPFQPEKAHNGGVFCYMRKIANSHGAPGFSTLTPIAPATRLSSRPTATVILPPSSARSRPGDAAPGMVTELMMHSTRGLAPAAGPAGRARGARRCNAGVGKPQSWICSAVTPPRRSTVAAIRN